MCDPLKFNRQLRHMDLTGTGITDVGLKELEDLFKEVRGRMLKVVFWGGRGLNPAPPASLNRHLPASTAEFGAILTDSQ